jgi:hypothetical protein
MHEETDRSYGTGYSVEQLGNFIPEGVKKWKEEDHAPNKGNHDALVAINSSYDSWIIDSGASHHMAAKEKVFSLLNPCSRPPILMGDDTPVAVAGEGRVELHNGNLRMFYMFKIFL